MSSLFIRSGGFGGCLLGGAFCFCSFPSEKLISLFPCFWWPFSVGLELFEVFELLYADNSPALREFIAADERPLFALAYYELAVLALVTLHAGRLRRRFGRQWSIPSIN